MSPSLYYTTFARNFVSTLPTTYTFSVESTTAHYLINFSRATRRSRLLPYINITSARNLGSILPTAQAFDVRSTSVHYPINSSRVARRSRSFSTSPPPPVTFAGMHNRLGTQNRRRHQLSNATQAPQRAPVVATQDSARAQPKPLDKVAASTMAWGSGNKENEPHSASAFTRSDLL
jgi:hypothetical protein